MYDSARVAWCIRFAAIALVFLFPFALANLNEALSELEETLLEIVDAAIEETGARRIDCPEEFSEDYGYYSAMTICGVLDGPSRIPFHQEIINEVLTEVLGKDPYWEPYWDTGRWKSGVRFLSFGPAIHAAMSGRRDGWFSLMLLINQYGSDQDLLVFSMLDRDSWNRFMNR